MSDVTCMMRDYRKRLGYTQTDISYVTGLSREHLGRIESGAVMPSLTHADAIARVMQATVYDIWPGLGSAMYYRHAIDRARLDGRSSFADEVVAYVTGA